MNELLSLAHFEPTETASGSSCRDSGLVQQPFAQPIGHDRQSGGLFPVQLWVDRRRLVRSLGRSALLTNSVRVARHPSITSRKRTVGPPHPPAARRRSALKRARFFLRPPSVW